MKNSQSVDTVGESNKSRIKPLHALSEVFSSTTPAGNIKDILDALENHVRNAATAKGLEQPTGSAFSNTRGTWFELIIAISAWNYRIDNGLANYYFIKLPNIKAFNFRSIFDQQTRIMFDQLNEHLDIEGCKFTVPNPDLLIIDQPGLIKDADYKLEKFEIEELELLTKICNKIENCPWDSVKAGIGLTTSLRPDRRYQLVNEGNILKSIFAHLRLRNWKSSFEFKYHAGSGEGYSKADEDGFQTAASHTLVNIGIKPERAVDDIHSLETIQDIYTMLDKIIKK